MRGDSDTMMSIILFKYICQRDTKGFRQQFCWYLSDKISNCVLSVSGVVCCLFVWSGVGWRSPHDDGTCMRLHKAVPAYSARPKNRTSPQRKLADGFELASSWNLRWLRIDSKRRKHTRKEPANSDSLSDCSSCNDKIIQVNKTHRSDCFGQQPHKTKMFVRQDLPHAGIG